MTALHVTLTAEVPAGRRRGTLPPLAWELSALAAVTVLLFLAPYVVGAYALQVGFLVLQLAALSTAWNLLAGYTGMVSLGSAAFVGIGVYTMAEVDRHLTMPYPLTFLLAGAVAAVFAVVVSPAMFRLRGLYFTIGTLALAEALRIWMVNSSLFGGTSGIFLTSQAPPAYLLYWMSLATAAFATAVVLVVLRRPLALRLNAVRDDEDVARTMGVFTFRTKLWAFIISSFLMGIVGAVQALNAGVVEPNGSFGMSWTVDIVMVTIIGGLATRTGPWLGAVLAVALEQALRGYAEIHLALTGLVLLLVIRFAPHGIWGVVVARSTALRAPQGERS
jgi:branched-chain amino acid transport system permease protein